jgi:hypothetical protein
VDIHSLCVPISIASASRPDGSLENQSVMVRARCIVHWRNLQKCFPARSRRYSRMAEPGLSLSVDYPWFWFARQ